MQPGDIIYTTTAKGELIQLVYVGESGYSNALLVKDESNRVAYIFPDEILAVDRNPKGDPQWKKNRKDANDFTERRSVTNSALRNTTKFLSRKNTAKLEKPRTTAHTAGKN